MKEEKVNKKTENVSNSCAAGTANYDASFVTGDEGCRSGCQRRRDGGSRRTTIAGTRSCGRFVVIFFCFGVFSVFWFSREGEIQFVTCDEVTDFKILIHSLKRQPSKTSINCPYKSCVLQK